MSDWFETLEGLNDQLWDTLVQGVVDSSHPARHPTFATVSPDGWPEARTVVLRGADQIAGMISVFTDLQSAKVDSLRRTPRAALHIWDAANRLQLRLSCMVKIQHGPDITHIWAQVPEQSRHSYGVTPAPGRPIAGDLDYVKSPDPASFAVLDCTVITIDAVHLGPDHRRARFRRDADWQGEWLVP
jgi:pyridoxamine 5'-phosphate oxidase